MTDKHLDDAIDRAVRAMTSGEPATDLRRRVLDDITQPASRVIGWRATAYGVAALAAVVLLALNLVVRRPAVPETRIAGAPVAAPSVQPSPPPPAAPRQTAEQRPVSPSGRNHQAIVPSRGTSAATAATTVTPNATDRRVEAASISSDLALESASAVAERLAPVVPIGISAIGTKDIQIAPIDIGRIDVAPLTQRR